MDDRLFIVIWVQSITLGRRQLVVERISMSSGHIRRTKKWHAIRYKKVSRS